jgi:hypothetical protein
VAVISDVDIPVAVSIANGDYSIDGGGFTSKPFAIALDVVGNRALVTHSDPGHSIIAVDLASGARTVLSDDSTPNGVNPPRRR